MTDLKSLSKTQLIESADRAVDIENDAIENTTRHFEEIFRRQDYLPEFPSMFEMLVRRWGYSRASAQMRLDTIRLIWEIPLAKEKLEAGEISMTVAAKMQSFLRSEKKAERELTREEKTKLLTVCVGKTEFEAEKVFAKMSPEAEKREIVKPISETKVRMNLNVSIETYEKLNDLRDILSHVDPSMTLGDLIERLAEDGFEKYSPKRKADRAKARREKKAAATAVNVKPGPNSETSSSGKKSGRAPNLEPLDNPVRAPNLDQPDESVRGANLEKWDKPVRPANLDQPDKPVRPANRERYVAASERHDVEDDGLGCTFVDPNTGLRCGSRKFLQLDHVHSFAEGGASTAENLRWMCGAHNRYRYEHGLN